METRTALVSFAILIVLVGGISLILPNDTLASQSAASATRSIKLTIPASEYRELIFTGVGLPNAHASYATIYFNGKQFPVSVTSASTIRLPGWNFEKDGRLSIPAVSKTQEMRTIIKAWGLTEKGPVEFEK